MLSYIKKLQNSFEAINLKIQLKTKMNKLINYSLVFSKIFQMKTIKN
jgi:hypothetical protein